MKKIKVISVIFILCLLFISVVNWQVNEKFNLLPTFGIKKSNVKWYSVEEGFKIAGKEGKYVLMDVYTDWCGWCKVMDEKTYTDPSVVGYLKQRFILVKLNAESSEEVKFLGNTYEKAELAFRLDVRSYPMTIFFESEDNPITKVPGYWTPEDFINVIQYIGDDWYKKIGYQEFLGKVIEKG